MNLTYFIVGLGMIGSSYAHKLSLLGHTVYGYDIDEKTNKLAVEKGYIKEANKNKIKEVDAVILTLYPEANILFVKAHQELLKDVKYLTDVSGVKQNVISNIESLYKGHYCSHHPMAGSEQKGILASNYNIFNNANFLVVRNDNTTEESIVFLKDLANKLSFKTPKIITEKDHDLMISFVSQLPHMIAVGLVNSDIYSNSSEFTGDSFKDLTRIANINEDLWLELFLSNKDNLIKDMKRFNNHFNDLINQLEQSNKEQLKELLIQAKNKRSAYDKKDKH